MFVANPRARHSAPRMLADGECRAPGGCRCCPFVWIRTSRMAPDDQDNPTPEEQPETSAEQASDSTPEDGGAGGESQPSLQEIIAEQRARLKARLAAKQAAGGSGAPAEAPEEAQKAESPEDGAPDAGSSHEPAVEKSEQESTPDAKTEAAEKSAPAAASSSFQAPETFAGRTDSGPALLRPRFVQGVLLVNTLLIALIGGLLLWTVLGRGGSVPKEVTAAPRQDSDDEGEGFVEVVDEGQALSWAAAEKAFAAGDLEAARPAYGHLWRLASGRPGEALVADFLSCRLAQCQWRTGRVTVAQKRLRLLTASDSIRVRAGAWQELALIDADRGQSLQARIKAYRSAAYLAGLPNAAEFEADCDFLVAKALTVEALSLYGRQSAVAWGHPARKDLFGGLGETELREALKEGAELANDSTLSAQVGSRVDSSGRRLWSVFAYDTAVEDLLNVYGTQAGLEVRWDGLAPAQRRRVVTVLARDVTGLRLAETVCGAAGLIARFTGPAVIVRSTENLETLSDRRELLIEETKAAWRRFFLRRGGQEDERVPLGHYAMACVMEHSGDTLGALQEYQRTANRYSRHRVAPEALLGSARLRIVAGHYLGARRDLEKLLNNYPTFQACDQVCLRLAEVNRTTGRLAEAIRDFRDLYDRNLTPESRAGAAFGLGLCFHDSGKHASAIPWLERYIGLVEDDAPRLPEAYLLLGRCQAALGNDAESEALFLRVLATNPSAEHRGEILLALARAYMKRQRLVQAVGALANADPNRMEPPRRCERSVLLARAFRLMGLPEKSAGLLREELALVMRDPLRGTIQTELAAAYRARGDMSRARKLLSEAVLLLPSGPDCERAKRDLAEVCLELGDTRQALTWARSVRDGAKEKEFRTQVNSIIGKAYMVEGDYERAALAFSDLLDAADGKETP